MTAEPAVTVVGAGLAGCEAAVKLARGGLSVELVEMKPGSFSPAHGLALPAELVCSNSLKSDAEDNAHGLLKRELRRLGSVVMAAADRSRIPAGTALAVDRVRFSETMLEILAQTPRLRYRQGEEVREAPGGDVVIATGPLTTEPLARWLQDQTGGGDDLYFYDALAPIIEASSVDRNRVFAASRWGRGEPDDYLNCPLDQEQYRRFLTALREAPKVPFREFEQPRYFEGCLPVEVLAERGDETLLYGPMRPVGLAVEGRRPFAVVQLRAENRERTAFNLVGFQTKLTQGAQREVLRLIPGLERAEFLRYGAVHRNLYLNAPRVLNDELGLVGCPRIRLAGQMTGVEGYVESAAIGLLVGVFVGRTLRGLPRIAPPPESAMGALYRHVRGAAPCKRYEPMNIHFGLFPGIRARGKLARRKKLVELAAVAFEAWMHTMEEAQE